MYVAAFRQLKSGNYSIIKKHCVYETSGATERKLRRFLNLRKHYGIDMFVMFYQNPKMIKHVYPLVNQGYHVTVVGNDLHLVEHGVLKDYGVAIILEDDKIIKLSNNSYRTIRVENTEGASRVELSIVDILY